MESSDVAIWLSSKRPSLKRVPADWSSKYILAAYSVHSSVMHTVRTDHRSLRLHISTDGRPALCIR